MVRLTRTRLLQARILLVFYVLGTFLPTGLASAQSFFSRPGAGVSRLPLHVWAFQAPGFGEVSDAINLANGNVFVSMDSYGRNNLFGTSAGTGNVVPEDSAIPASNGQWNYTSRLRLSSFDTRIGSSTTYPIPNSFTLGSSDGSGQTFNKVTLTDFTAASGLPSWITRYKSTSNVAFYKNVYYPGMDYKEEWLVMLIQRQYKPVGQPAETLVHYYDHGGTRYTFYGDGQYVDYIQNPYQQYRSAKVGQTEGIDTAFKTSICYNINSTNRSIASCYGSASAVGVSNQGKIRKVFDEYKRATTYEWNSNGTLWAINYLLRDGDVEGSWARRVEFFYTTKVLGGVTQNLVNQVTFKTSDMLDAPDVNKAYKTPNIISRWVRLEYTDPVPANGNRILVSKVKRQVMKNDIPATENSIDTGYGYDAQGRVILVTQTGMADTTYAYAAVTGGGQTVTMTQSDKRSTYEFNNLGELKKKTIRDNNPVAGSDTSLTWAYNYVRSASDYKVSIATPSDTLEQYVYDLEGNLTKQRVGLVSEATTETTFTAAGSSTKETIYTYDSDNRVRTEITPARVKSSIVTEKITGVPEAYDSANGSYNYPQVKIDHAITDYSFTAPNTQIFSAASSKVSKTIVGSATTEKFKITDTYNERGFLTQSERVGAGQTKTTLYTYFNPDFKYRQFIPITNAGYGYNWAATDAWQQLQYEDLVQNVQVKSGTTVLSNTSFNYDQFGNTMYSWENSAFVTDFNTDYTPVSRNRETIRIHNGFGQLIYENVFVNPNPGVVGSWQDAVVRRWVYQDTGELNYSWEGNPQNLTDYAYNNATTVNLGRPYEIKRGIQSSTIGIVGTSHETTNGFVYDSFGRVTQKTVDTFPFNYKYDTLDRVVEEKRPDGGTTQYTYDTTLQVKQTTVSGQGSTVNHHDKFGRTIITVLPDSSRIHTAYDVYDRPIKVVDKRLTMQVSGDDQVTYYRYNEMGNILYELRPALRTNAGNAYVDSRRPFTFYGYDALYRLTIKLVAISGSTTIDNVNTGGDSITEYSRTETTYDAFDRAIRVKDPESYITQYEFDASNNPYLTNQQICRSGDTTCINSSQNLGPYGGVENTLTTRIGYDAAGRVLNVIDAISGRSNTVYDALGNLVRRRDARTIVTHLYSYTPDGLLDCTAEPDMDAATSANPTTFMNDCTPPSGYVVTSRYDYGSRRYPAGMRVANMNTATPSGPRTAYDYDYAGRVRTTTLPDNNTIVQSYDTRGNLLSIKDADGFVTQYTYDSMNRMTEEYKPPRSTAADHQDVLAGLGAGLRNFYTYDAASNLTQEISNSRGDVSKPNHNGLMTNYEYNSLGKVVAESRPYFAGTTTYKLTRYRPDGIKTATTTYNYTGNFSTSAVEIYNPPTVTSGNVTLYEADGRGYTTAEVALPTTSPCTTGTQISLTAITFSYTYPCGEYAKKLSYNGLGKIIKREFTGSLKVYDDTTKETYWFYDAKANLIESYHFRAGSTTKLDNFTYTYSPTNKEIGQTRRVELFPGASINYGASFGSVTTTYNERDLTNTVTLNDYGEHSLLTASTVNQVANSHTNKYYPDGLLKNVDTTASDMLIGGIGGKTFTYDTRGRVVTEEDPDGSKTYADDSGDLQTQSFQRETTKTTYGQFGIVTQTVVFGTAASPSCHLVTKTTPTINGLTWKYEEWDNSVGTCGTDGQQSKQNIYTYTPRGQLAKNDETLREDDDVNNATAPIKTTNKYDYAYDVYNNQTSEFLDRTIGTVNNPRKEVKTTTYNGLNAATSVIARPFEEPNPITITYGLDSLGNRISVGGDTNNANRFYGYSKLYDASGKVVRLSRVQNLSDLTRKNYIIFRYDPFGHEVFSSTSEDFERKIWVSPALIRQVLRSTFTTIYSGNDVVFMRVRGKPADPTQAAYTMYSDGATFDKYSKHDNIKNESFSMADTINAVQWVNIDTFSIEEPTGAFEAPVDALSTTLQVDPLEVRPPDTETPSQPSEDAGDITPPSGDEAQTGTDEPSSDDSDTQATTNEQASTDEQAPTDGQATTSKTDVNAPLPALNATTLATPGDSLSTGTPTDTSVVLPDATSATTPLPTTTALDATGLNAAPLDAPTTLTALPGLGEVPATGTAATPGTGEATSNEGDSALPESINQLSSSDVTPPEGSLPTTFEATNPDEITSPDDASVPQVGVSASDSPLDVVMPESLNASVPTIGDGSPEAIDAVAPPAAWLKAKDDALIATLAVPGETGKLDRKRARDNDSQTSNNKDKSQQTTGRKNTPDREKNVRNKEDNNSYGKASSAGARDKAERDAARQDRANPKNKAKSKQNEAVNDAQSKGNLGNPLRMGNAGAGGISAPRGPGGINWGDVGKAVAAAGKAIAEAAKVAGPAVGRIIGGVAGAVIIGSQAADGELPENLMTEEDKEAQETPDYDAYPPETGSTKSGGQAKSVDDLSEEELEELGDKIGQHSWNSHQDQADENGLTADDLKDIAKEILTGQRGERLDDTPWDDGSVGYHESEYGYGLLANPNHEEGGTMFIPETGPGEDTRDAFDSWLDRVNNR